MKKKLYNKNVVFFNTILFWLNKNLFLYYINIFYIIKIYFDWMKIYFDIKKVYVIEYKFILIEQKYILISHKNSFCNISATICDEVWQNLTFLTKIIKTSNICYFWRIFQNVYQNANWPANNLGINSWGKVK